MIYILIILLVILGFIIVHQYHKDIKTAYKRLESYNIKTMATKFGIMSYVDEGKGEVILISHGIFGGYDQGSTSLNQVVGEQYRKVSISRFGYPGSKLPNNPTPKNQAKVFIEILDELGIKQAYILATSAGGAAGFQFALTYPDRSKGLILLSSSVPDKKRNTDEVKALGTVGPPKLLINDFFMWFFTKYFGFIFNSMMGSDVNKNDLFKTMLPVKPRKQGILADTKITNMDMLSHYEKYTIERLEIPILVIHAKDDPMAKYENVENLLIRVKAEAAIFETGGHTIDGHADQVKRAIRRFVEKEK
ncbi:alpha/beta fold hydrolase [Liquorilactobacillus uvarum]|uniref:alpha/beta fold hydrolase n=2 Tax=Liquorilactobacillus uvarum TaxID=303240 RepID=UPI00288946DB|nr:alpha/beta hydrolase [Liquorilactobacillus uvarum]